MRIKIFIDLVARVVLIALALVIVGYLLFSNEADGDRVNIHQRWFEYGEPSFPVQDSNSKLAVNYSLLSPRELDAKENPYYWITESGDVLAVTNLTGVKRDVEVTLNFLPNPCKNGRQIVIGTESKSIQLSVPIEGKVSHTLSFVLDEGKTKFFSITPLPGKICNIGNSDFRNFITLLSNIKIKSNAI
jgi:hypothetical protein